MSQCKEYVVDIAAPMFGACKCGAPKDRHTEESLAPTKGGRRASAFSGADLSNADCFVKCPGAGCSQHVSISTPGCVERCLCQCGFLFCSLCLRQFHGIPPGGAAPLAPPKLGSRSSWSSSTPNRLYCSGAASISAAWESYKNSKLAPSSTAPCTTKHHVDPSDLLPVAALLKLERMATSEYRLQCGMCSNDVIGLRFSCIHCPGGLELCVDCAVRPDVKHHGGGSGPHAFQIYNSDQNPPAKPQARCGICYDAKWSGRKVTFNYMNCAECRTQLADELLVDSMKEHLELKARVEKMCVEKCLEDEVMHGLEELFAADPKAACAAALDKLTVLQCSSCSQPFCGGRIDCQEDDSLDITRIRCAPCAFEVQEQLAAAERKKAPEAAADQEAVRQLTTGWKAACRKHGFKSAIYKCDGCCAVAV